MLQIASESFRKYCAVIEVLDLSDLVEAARAIPMPGSGVVYRPSIPELEATGGFELLRRVYAGEQEIEGGMCWGYNEYMGGVEYHRASEVNIAVTDMVAVFGDRRNIVDNTYDSALSEAFFIPQGTVFEIYATTLHLAPCSAGRDGFKSIVILPRGTNEPLSAEGLEAAKRATGEHRMLWARDKWILTFPGTEDARNGMCDGMRGEDRRCAAYDA